MEPRKYELKNGRVLLIREVSVEDARALLDYVERISGESDFLSFGPGEFELTEGLIGATLYLASGFLPLFGHGTRSTIYNLMEAPLGLQEMVLAVWLIVEGFNSSAIASESA